VLTKKINNTRARLDTVKVQQGSNEVDVKKILQLDPGESVAKEIFPNSAHRLRIESPDLDVRPAVLMVNHPDYQYKMPQLSYTDNLNIRLKISVWPKNAGWKLESPTGVNMGSHTDVVYYGDQELILDGFSELPEEGKQIQIIRAVPYKGTEAEPCDFVFQQYKGPEINIDTAVSFNFDNTLYDTTNTYHFVNTLQNELIAEGKDLVTYAQLRVDGDYGVVSLYDADRDEGSEDTPYRYEVDLSSVLSPNWFEEGFSFTAVVAYGDNTKIGFLNDAVDDYEASLSSSYGFVIAKGLLNLAPFNSVNPSQRLRRELMHLGYTFESETDLDAKLADGSLTISVIDVVGREFPILELGSEMPSGPVDRDNPAAGGYFDTTNWGSGWEFINSVTNNVRLTFSYNGKTGSIAGWDYVKTGTTEYPIIDNTLNSIKFIQYKVYQNSTEILQKGVFVSAASIKGEDKPAFPADGIFQVVLSNDKGGLQAISNLNIYNETVSQEVMEAETVSNRIRLGNSVVSSEKEEANPQTWAHQPIEEVDFSTLHLKTFLIDDETIVFGLDPTDFYVNQMKIEKPNYWVNDYNGYYHHDPYWRVRFVFEFNWYELSDKYDPRFIDELDAPETNLTVVTTSSGEARPYTMIGRYSDMMSNFNMPDGYRNIENGFDKNYNRTSFATCVMNQFVYMKLDTPLAENESITISYRGQSITAVNSRDAVSRAIKVNQVGYCGDTVTCKKAYVGQWLGFLSDAPNWEDRAYDPVNKKSVPWDLTFHVIDANDASSTPLYTGTATPRCLTEDEDRKQHHLYKQYNLIQSGEKVWELDFTEFGTPGEYQIYIPGIGYSWPFKIGNEAAVYSFYTHMRGLWHHRSGDPNLDSRYTGWEMPYSTSITWEGQFPPRLESFNNGELINENGVTWGQLNGEDVFFGVMEPSKTGKMFRDVKGGWRDAADIDRRPLHNRITRGLCEQFLFDPTRFTDGQLNFHTSGNGIPDILDEAEWGMEVWRRTQTEEGAVSAWIETDKHEGYYTLFSGEMNYCSSLPDCYSSLIFAQNAAMLARCYALIDNDIARRKHEVWYDAAVRAFNFGSNRDNTPSASFGVGNQYYTYREDYNARAVQIVWPAAACLYMLTKDSKYSAYFTDTNWNNFFNTLKRSVGSYANGNFSYETLLELEEITPKETQALRKYIELSANFWHLMFENSPYRYPHFNFAGKDVTFSDPSIGIYPIEDAYPFTKSGYKDAAYADLTQFAGGHLDNKAVTIMYMYMLTKDQKWKDAIQKQVDQCNGANGIGVTETTGLGYVNPVWGLQGQQTTEYSEGVQVTPIPGISFYTHWQVVNVYSNCFSQVSGANKQAWATAVNLRSANPPFAGTFLNKLPGGYRSVYGGNMGSMGASGLIAEFCRKNIPKWRPRFNKQGPWYPIAGEYTIWETIYWKAIANALLMESNGDVTPDPTWHMEAPKHRREVEGWFHLS
jgi:hypothetical protein